MITFPEKNLENTYLQLQLIQEKENTKRTLHTQL